MSLIDRTLAHLEHVETTVRRIADLALQNKAMADAARGYCAARDAFDEGKEDALTMQINIDRAYGELRDAYEAER
jgi:hypothetical protein